jgi:hypothetical protein
VKEEIREESKNLSKEWNKREKNKVNKKREKTR